MAQAGQRGQENGGNVRLSNVVWILRGVAGFTLVEALLAIVLTSVMAVGGLALVEIVVRGNTTSKRLTKATSLAVQKTEELRNLDFTYADLAPSATGCPTTANSSRPDPAASFEGGTYSRYFCVTDIGAAPIRGKQVDVFVDYQSRSGTKTLPMSTIIAKVEPWDG